ncbi:rhodanese-related sulfurtransferase [Bacillus tianshenii]|uniref:Rhodanese-related sulfurtransferase n=1 Tax=Sutcliffiella tianshenii TaxID=1463404 RepID=A0ABS2NZS4_9BACI|nr:rhodanese-related sulfurtransferase [Bacillus tianshenii]
MYVLLGVLGAIIAYSVIMFLYQRKILTTLSEEDFRSGYRKAQLIDVREQKEYEGGHILGARNIPLSQLKMRSKEIRNDQPVYIYCQNTLRSGRAAQMLKKQGHTKLYQLKGGFKQWGGKIRTKN